MDFEKIDIKELLPQKSPFIMVDTFVHFDEINTITNLAIKEDNLFVDKGVMTAFGLMENIAQSCAVRIGYINRYILKKEIKIGFIGSIKNFKICRFPVLNETISTKIEVLEEIFKMILVRAEITSAGEILAEAEMKIALSDINSQTKESNE